MKTRRIKLTLAIPDFWHLLRVIADRASSASDRAQQLRIPRPGKSTPPSIEALDSFELDEIVRVDESLESPDAPGPAIFEKPKLTPMHPLNKAGMRGRVLAIAFSLTTLEDYITAGQFGRFQRILARYARSFDAIYVLTPDSTDFTSRLGVPKALHLGMPRWIPFRRYLSLVILPFIHRRKLANVTVVRTFNTPAGITGSLIRRRTGARVLVSFGYSWAKFVSNGSNIKGRFARVIENRSLKTADELIVATPPQRDLLSDLYPEKPVHLLPNFVDTGMFCPTLNTDPTGAPFLLFVGRLEHQKNLPALFDALEIARQTIPALRLAVVGEGSLRYQLEQDAIARELPVEFTGAVEHESLPSLFARAFAYVLPSDYEGMPKSLLEAMSTGASCIATDVPGTRDLITHGLSGLLVPAGNAESMANAIIRLHREPALRTRLGSEARRFVEARFSLDASLNREVDILLDRSIRSSSATPPPSVQREEAAA